MTAFCKASGASCGSQISRRAYVSRSRSIGLSSARKRSASDVAVSRITRSIQIKSFAGRFITTIVRDVMTRSPGARAYPVGVVILAAGRSARMGKPKLLLPWGGTSVLGHLIEEWRALHAKQIDVVCDAGNPAGASSVQVARSEEHT